MSNNCSETINDSDLETVFGKTAKDAYIKINNKKKEILNNYTDENEVSKEVKKYFIGEPVKQYTKKLMDDIYSSCEKVDLNNLCKFNVSNASFNIIRLTDKCTICNRRNYEKSTPEQKELVRKFCSINNVKQQNVSEIKQDCLINVTLKDLYKKKNVDAHAIANILQDSNESFSEKNSRNLDYDSINENISSKDYLNMINECVNYMNIDQQNLIEHCGPVADVFQKNEFSGLQTCLIQSGNKISKSDYKTPINNNSTKDNYKYDNSTTDNSTNDNSKYDNSNTYEPNTSSIVKNTQLYFFGIISSVLFFLVFISIFIYLT